MFRIALRISMGFAVCAVIAASLDAQSLADIARKEQERRKAVKTPSKVYTNADLGKGVLTTGSQTTESAEGAKTPPGAPGQPPAAPGAAASTPPGQPAPGAPPAAAAPTPPEPPKDDPKKDEKYWRDRITAARTQLERSKLFLEALQSRLNALSTDFVARDDPYQRAVIGQERQKTLGEMERVLGEIAQLTKDIADIEEEARRLGVPPGWLRD